MYFKKWAADGWKWMKNDSISKLSKLYEGDAFKAGFKRDTVLV